MELFIDIALSFPVVVFSLSLSVAVIYWVLVCVGVLDIETVSVDIDLRALKALDFGLSSSSKRRMFRHLPDSVALTLTSVIGWLLSYFCQLLLIHQMALGYFYYLLGFVSGLVCLFLALASTVVIARLCSPLLDKVKGPPPRALCGQVAVVRSPQVTASQGQALLENGGAGLLLQVRACSPKPIMRGDRVVLLQYVARTHVWQVISESEFKG